MHAFMAAALATGVVVAGGTTPVTAVGEEGWIKYGTKGAFSVEFDADSAIFTDDVSDEGVDMRLQRIALKPLSAYAGSSIEGRNAQLTLEGSITDGGAERNYTSIVFYTADSPEDRVHLTWGGDASNDEYIPVDTFWQRVASGHYAGTINFERVGHTNTADNDGEVARVDEVTVRGSTYDFGVGNTIIPIEAEGQEGWRKSGKGTSHLGWTGDAVTFTGEAAEAGIDMGLKRYVATDIMAYRDAAITGDNAFLTVEMMTTSLKYTSVVFSSDNPDQVILTWGGSPDEYLTMDQFQARLDSGKLTGAVYSEHVGHINTGDTNGEEALVDEVSFAGTTYDFRGQAASGSEGPEGPVMPEVTPEEPKPGKPGKPEKPETPKPDKPGKPGKP